MLAIYYPLFKVFVVGHMLYVSCVWLAYSVSTLIKASFHQYSDVVIGFLHWFGWRTYCRDIHKKQSNRKTPTYSTFRLCFLFSFCLFTEFCYEVFVFDLSLSCLFWMIFLYFPNFTSAAPIYIKGQVRKKGGRVRIRLATAGARLSNCCVCVHAACKCMDFNRWSMYLFIILKDEQSVMVQFDSEQELFIPEWLHHHFTYFNVCCCFVLLVFVLLYVCKLNTYVYTHIVWKIPLFHSLLTFVRNEK